MSDYISRDEFIESQRHLYCENCARRKGMKRGKMQFVYEIGDAPCRACGYGDVLDDLEYFPAADVRENKRGKWKLGQEDIYSIFICSECGDTCYWSANFCPNCGADMREEQT